MDSSSSDDDDLDPAAAERRQRAIQLLAKVLKKPAGSAVSSDKDHKGAPSNGDAEASFLRALLDDLKKGTPANEMVRSVRDRLTVIGVQSGTVQVQSSAKATVRQPSALTNAPGAAPDDDDASEDGDGATAQLPKILQRLRDGDASAVSSRVRSAAFWRALAGDSLAKLSERPIHGAGRASKASIARRRVSEPIPPHPDGAEQLCIPHEQLSAMRASLRTRGYGVVQPTDGVWGWGELVPVLAALRAIADTFREAGWPPAFIFTLDEAWAVLDQLWTPMEALLGEGCAMDPSVFCWIAARPAPMGTGDATLAASAQSSGSNMSNATESSEAAANPPASATTPGGVRPRAGANFGVPHRDFTCLQSLRKADGAPAVLSVWLPLNEVTPENGCMMVVPRQLDAHFTKRWAYAHMRPALPPDDDETDGAMEVRFNLAAAKPLAPLGAGSIAAWVGNVIHWGTCCLPDAPTAARASIGFNFLAQGERLQSSAPMLTRSSARELDLDARLSLIARSLLAYSPWYALSDDAVPPTFFPEAQELPSSTRPVELL